MTLSYTYSHIGSTAQYTCAFDGYAFEDSSTSWRSLCELDPLDRTKGLWTNAPNSCVRE